MKRFINTLKNIWNIKELRDRILYTLGLVLIYRIGSYVVIPGINPSDLTSLQDQTKDGVLGLLMDKGFIEVNTLKDYAGLDRVVYGTYLPMDSL